MSKEEREKIAELTAENERWERRVGQLHDELENQERRRQSLVDEAVDLRKELARLQTTPLALENVKLRLELVQLQNAASRGLPGAPRAGGDPVPLGGGEKMPWLRVVDAYFRQVLFGCAGCDVYRSKLCNGLVFVHDKAARLEDDKVEPKGWKMEAGHGAYACTFGIAELHPDDWARKYDLDWPDTFVQLEVVGAWSGRTPEVERSSAGLQLVFIDEAGNEVLPHGGLHRPHRQPQHPPLYAPTDEPSEPPPEEPPA